LTQNNLKIVEGLLTSKGGIYNPPGFEFDKYLPHHYLSLSTFLNEKYTRFQAMISLGVISSERAALKEQLADLASFAILGMSYIDSLEKN